MYKTILFLNKKDKKFSVKISVGCSCPQLKISEIHNHNLKYLQNYSKSRKFINYFLGFFSSNS